MFVDFLWAGLVAIILSLAMFLTSYFKRHISKELSRKLVHVTMGCVALTFPFIFNYRATILILGAITICTLALVRRNTFLFNSIGTSIFGIGRKSFGEIYFVLAIMFVHTFFVETYEYIIAISVLTFADSVAALVGTSYGRYKLSHMQEDTKSSEGSSTFFVVSYFCTLVPLQLLSTVGRAEVLLVSLIIAILSTLIEMISEKGNDNLLLPVLTFAFLRPLAYAPIYFMLTSLLLLGLSAIPIFIIYKKTGITKLSTAYAFLVVYVVLIQGGFAALLPPVMLFVTFGFLPKMCKEERSIPHTYRVIENNSTVGLAFLLLAGIVPNWHDIFIMGFSLAFAEHLAINTYSRLTHYTNLGKIKREVYSFAKAFVFISLPSFFIFNFSYNDFFVYLIFLCIATKSSHYLLKKHNYKEATIEKLNSHKKTTAVITAMFALLIIILRGIL